MGVDPLVWCCGLCLGIGEMHQGGLYLLPFALGAALAAVVSLLGVGRCSRALVLFVLASGDRGRRRCGPSRAATAGCRRRSAPAPRRWSAGARSVLERIANDEGVGCVRIEGGEVWTARSYDEDEVIDAGERVEVVEIRGATALVMH